MDINLILKNANPNVIIFLLTTLVAFISWLIKSLVENPIAESKVTFSKYFEKRIEILTEVKTRLNLIAYFPEEEDSLEYKNQLQEIYLKDGKIGYLSKEVYNNVLRISIDPKTNERLLLDTIKMIDDELYLKISKIQDEIRFYRRFSNYNPFKRFVGFTILALQYVFSFSLIISFFILLILAIIEVNNYAKFAIGITSIFGLFLANKWLKE